MISKCTLLSFILRFKLHFYFRYCYKSNYVFILKVILDKVIIIFVSSIWQCVRAATSHSRRNSSFQEDLLTARCEFENAPVKFAKLVSLAGDEKATEANQDNEEPAKSAGDSAVVVNLQ